MFARHPFKPRLLIVLALLLLAACQSSDVIVDFDTSQNFDQLRYYRWVDEPKLPGNNQEPLLRERADKAITAELEKASLSAATAEQPADVLVRSYLSTQAAKQSARSGPSIGIGGGNSSAGVSVRLPLGKDKPSKEVQIVVDLLTVNEQQLLWRGSKTLLLDNQSPQQVDSLVAAAVAEIFSFYPPKTTGQ